MKFGKTIAALVLLTTGTAVLASCNSELKSLDKPGIHAYAITYSDFSPFYHFSHNISEFGQATIISGETAIVKPTVEKEVSFNGTPYLDDEIIKVEYEGTLKYGENVVITIEPKAFFHLCDFDDFTWKPIRGTYLVPYVGLGSETSKFNYPLPEGTAWKYEEHFASGSNEKYRLTVYGEYFKKNIVIGFGYKEGGELNPDNMPRVVNSPIDNYVRAKPLIKNADNEQLLDMNETGSPIFMSDIRNCVSSIVDAGVTWNFYSEPSEHLDNYELAELVRKFDKSYLNLNKYLKIGTDGYYENFRIYGVKNPSYEPEEINEFTADKEPTVTPIKPEAGKFELKSNGDGSVLSLFLSWDTIADIDSADSDYAFHYDYFCFCADMLYPLEASVIPSDESKSYVSNLNYGFDYDAEYFSDYEQGILHVKKGESFDPLSFVFVGQTDGKKEGKHAFVKEYDESLGKTYDTFGVYNNEYHQYSGFYSTFEYEHYDEDENDKRQYYFPNISFTAKQGSASYSTPIKLDVEVKQKVDEETFVIGKKDSNGLWGVALVNHDKRTGFGKTVDGEVIKPIFALYSLNPGDNSSFYYANNQSLASSITFTIE